MATPWQYNYPGETKPVVNPNQGYAVNFPDQPSRSYRADKDHFTIALVNDQNVTRHLWAHQISMNFELAGSYAQSASFRAFYPRNFVQPHIQISGQCASQADHASLIEFIRKCQLQAIRGANNTTGLIIPQGSPESKITQQSGGRFEHQGHAFQGHILKADRTAERWVNAPEFQFEFLVVTASAGLYHTDTTDPSGVNDEIGQYIRSSEATQIRDRLNKPGWEMDPDHPGVSGYEGPH
jgi:hypothetical protein